MTKMIDTGIDFGTSGWMHYIDLAFNEERGDWDVILTRNQIGCPPWIIPKCETVTAFFHTLEEAKACVERNKKMWTVMKVPFIDENGEFHGVNAK